MAEFPDLHAWFERMRARDAVQTGYKVGADQRRPAASLDAQTKEAEAARAMLFGQRARR